MGAITNTAFARRSLNEGELQAPGKLSVSTQIRELGLTSTVRVDVGIFQPIGDAVPK